MKGPIAFLPTWVKRALSARNLPEKPDDDGDDNVDIPEGAMPPEVPCVGDEADERWRSWDQWRDWPEPPQDTEDTIEVKFWPEAGHPGISDGCRMAADHMEYAVLDAFGDSYDVTAGVSNTEVPEHVKDRSGFKEYVTEQADENPARHVNVHLGSDGPPGSACCGYGYVCVEDYFDDFEWTGDDCVKRRRWGPDAYGCAAALHEAMHCLGLTHYKKETTVDNQRHSTLMGVSYTSQDESGWHLFELHPNDDQQPTLYSVL